MEVEVLEEPTEKTPLTNCEEYMIGKRFGKLTVLQRGEEYYFPNGRHRDTWVCKCDCGVVKTILGSSLRYGRTVSCGCHHFSGLHKTHGMTHTRLYKCWKDMKSRCLNKNRKDYVNYGKRGIKVCDNWLDFSNFSKWALKNGYKDTLTLDRINVNGNYEPSNCRWASLKQQANNTRRNIRLLFAGKNLTYSEWEVETGINQHTIARRIRLGWSVEDALCTPLKKRR